MNDDYAASGKIDLFWVHRCVKTSINTDMLKEIALIFLEDEFSIKIKKNIKDELKKSKCNFRQAIEKSFFIDDAYLNLDYLNHVICLAQNELLPDIKLPSSPDEHHYYQEAESIFDLFRECSKNCDQAITIETLQSWVMRLSGANLQTSLSSSCLQKDALIKSIDEHRAYLTEFILWYNKDPAPKDVSSGFDYLKSYHIQIYLNKKDPFLGYSGIIARLLSSMMLMRKLDITFEQTVLFYYDEFGDDIWKNYSELDFLFEPLVTSRSEEIKLKKQKIKEVYLTNQDLHNIQSYTNDCMSTNFLERNHLEAFICENYLALNDAIDYLLEIEGSASTLFSEEEIAQALENNTAALELISEFDDFRYQLRIDRVQDAYNFSEISDVIKQTILS